MIVSPDPQGPPARRIWRHCTDRHPKPAVACHGNVVESLVVVRVDRSDTLPTVSVLQLFPPTIVVILLLMLLRRALLVLLSDSVPCSSLLLRLLRRCLLRYPVVV